MLKRLREEVERKGLKLSVNEHGKEEKEQHDCVVQLSGRRVAAIQLARKKE